MSIVFKCLLGRTFLAVVVSFVLVAVVCGGCGGCGGGGGGGGGGGAGARSRAGAGAGLMTSIGDTSKCWQFERLSLEFVALLRTPLRMLSHGRVHSDEY